MYFMFLKIINKHYKHDIFLGLESVDINRASFFDGYNLDKVLNSEIPIFKGFFDEYSEKEKEILIVTAYVEKKEQVIEFLTIMREAGIPIDKEEIIRVLLMPVSLVFDNKLGLVEE